MNDVVSQITPNTVGIIWLAKDERDTSHRHYTEIDYLVDGLLSANLKIEDTCASRIIVGQNFNRSLLVLIVNQMRGAEIESFVTLVKKDLGDENDILVVDEKDGFSEIEPHLREISHKLRRIN